MSASVAENRGLSGTTALVTGGARGIGRAIALALAREGAAVAIAARSADELDRTLDELRAVHDRAIAVQADITDRAAVDRMEELGFFSREVKILGVYPANPFRQGGGGR